MLLACEVVLLPGTLRPAIGTSCLQLCLPHKPHITRSQYMLALHANAPCSPSIPPLHARSARACRASVLRPMTGASSSCAFLTGLILRAHTMHSPYTPPPPCSRCMLTLHVGLQRLCTQAHDRCILQLCLPHRPDITRSHCALTLHAYAIPPLPAHSACGGCSASVQQPMAGACSSCALLTGGTLSTHAPCQQSMPTSVLTLHVGAAAPLYSGQNPPPAAAGPPNPQRAVRDPAAHLLRDQARPRQAALRVLRGPARP